MSDRELPEKLEKRFVICDNTVNRKKWRILVDGIQLDGFLKNPVCCVEHNTWGASIGKWKDVHVEGDKLLGTLEFDRNDPDAVKLYWKYEDGFMSAVSLHVIALEESAEPEMLEVGQIYPTITKSELLEVSVVTVPGQKNAVRLSDAAGNDYKLNLISKQNRKMEENKNQEQATRIAELESQLSAEKAKKADMLVQLHMQRGAVQEGEVDSLTKLALADFDTVETMLNARTVEVKKTDDKPADDERARLAAAIEKLNAGEAPKPNEKDSWSYMEWLKKDYDGLLSMQKNEQEKYKALEAALHADCEKNHLTY
jgi:phage head maturation protease